MGDCNLSLSYNAPKTEEKFCKYVYCSWCPTCDRESPRRRTKSETNEPCRRKGKEMKSPTSRRFDRSFEYENMDLEYETKDIRYDCCRIRSNLCELPTTYITNNYQNLSNLTKMSNGTNDLTEGIDKRNFKFSDLNNQVQNMSDKHKFMWKSEEGNKILNGAVHKFEVKSGVAHNLKTTHLHESRNVPPKNGLHLSANQENARRLNGVNHAGLLHRLSPIQNEMYNIELRNKIYTMSENRINSTAKNKMLDNKNGYSDFKLDSPKVPNRNTEVSEKNGHSYETCTFFDKMHDATSLQEKYTKEIDLLRGKLRQLRGANYNEIAAKSYSLQSDPPTVYDQMKTLNQPKTVLKINSDVPVSSPTIKSPLLIKTHSSTIKSPSSTTRAPTIIKSPLPVKPPSDIKSTLINKPSILNEKTIIVDGDVKRNKPLASKRDLKCNSKISLKTRSKANLVRLRKIKSKAVHNVAPVDISSGSDYSDSAESDDEESLEEVTISVSETSIKEAPAKPYVPLILRHPEGGDGINWPLRASLFPNIPPYIKFNSYDAITPFKLPTGRRYLKWKLSTITPIVVRKTLLNTGFRLVRSEFSRESNEWLGTWGKHMKSPMFKVLKETQKLNHFPGTFQLGRKDRLWRNFQRLICRFGHKEFGFIPQTYVLPQDLKMLKQNWEYKNGSGEEKWIIKPPASARGVGIRVINRWAQLPKRMSLVVQKYISNPYLINGSKFDLRLYVLVTSFNPLRIYLYPDGLARFASAKYSDDVKDLKDRYMHLTNYSINKLSSQYTANEDANACQGHKWTISKLWEFMDKQGVNTRLIWRTLEQLVIKTIISGEGAITQHCEENMMSRYNSYELFGIDVLLDEKLKPWLLEVNISPSLHSSSPLDAYIKGPLVKSLFDMAQFHLPPQIINVDNSIGCYDSKLYTTALTKKERTKHLFYTQLETRVEYLADILDDLTGDDVRHLTQAEDELMVTGKFKRIFPTAHSHVYLQYMEPRYYNRLFDAWENQFDRNRQPGIKLLKSLCALKVHLKVAPQSTVNKNLLSMNYEEVSGVPPMPPMKEVPVATIREIAADLIAVPAN